MEEFAHGAMGEVVIGDLLPCPFCGAPAKVEFEGREADMIWCGGNNCALQPILWFCNFDSIEETVATWNSRKPMTDDDRLIVSIARGIQTELGRQRIALDEDSPEIDITAVAKVTLALAAGTQSAETRETAAPCEARQRGSARTSPILYLYRGGELTPMTTELKPCPFCGGEPFRADGGTCFVGCSSSTEECPVSPTVRTFGNADAVKFWNTRPQPIVTTDGPVERVEQLVELGFATVSRNPSDWEASQAWRHAIRLAVEEAQSLTDRIASLERALTEIAKDGIGAASDWSDDECARYWSRQALKCRRIAKATLFTTNRLDDE